MLRKVVWLSDVFDDRAVELDQRFFEEVNLRHGDYLFLLSRGLKKGHLP